MSRAVLQRDRRQALCARRAVHAVLLAGLLVSGGPALLVSQAVAAGTSETTLTLKTRYTKATCLFTRHGTGVTGTQEVIIPAVDLNVVSGAGGNEWNGEVVPLNLGIRCSALPETGVGISLTVSPENADTGAGENIIASKKTTGINIAGPDLLLVDTGNPVTRVTFSPGLALPGGKCSGDISPGSGNCLEMSGNGSDYRIPLGVRVFIPATGGSGLSRAEMLTPGAWTSVVTLNISYQ